MPWCDTCDKHIDDDVRECEACGSVVDRGDSIASGSKPPWHFWVIVVALIAYLIWRLVVFVGGFF